MHNYSSTTLAGEESKNQNNLEYYEQYLKLIKANTELKEYLDSITETHKSLKKLVEKNRKKEEQGSDSNDKDPEDEYLQKKRRRRSKTKIVALTQCQYCDRTYGSESSKNQHIKLKHSTQ